MEHNRKTGMESRKKKKEMEEEEKLMNFDTNICPEIDELMMNLCKENLPCASKAKDKAPETVPTTSNRATILKYDYCQTKEAVKVSIEVPGICIDDMNVELFLTVTELSFCFELKGFKKKNWKLEVLHLAHEIVFSEVLFVAENDKGTLVLPKKIPIEWASLTPTDDTLRNEWNLIFKDSYIELIPGATRESFDSIFSDVLENVWSSAYTSACIGNSSLLRPLDQIQQEVQLPKDFILEVIEDMIDDTKKMISAEPWVSHNFTELGKLLLEKLIRRNGGVYTNIIGSNAQPRDSNYYYNLALKYYLECEALNAMTTVNKTLQLDRSHSDGRKLKLKLLEILEVTNEARKEQKNLHFKKTISLYKKVMDIDPSHERLKLLNLNNIAECFLMQMNYVSAIEYLTKVLEYAKVDREIVLFYLKRAKCYKLLKRWQEAVNDYELANKILPHNIHKVLLEEAKLRLTAHNNRKDYYAVLGLDSKASMKIIWKSYKKLEKSYELSTDDDKLTREEKFKEIREAYSILFDPVKREKYDKNEEPIAPVADGEETIRQRIILNSILPSNEKISWVWSDII